MTAYSSGTPICACCGEDEERFLTIDHMNNDGAKHRREVTQGSHLYGWLKRNNYPAGFQVLCYNCNVGRYRNRNMCPHQQPGVGWDRYRGAEPLTIRKSRG